MLAVSVNPIPKFDCRFICEQENNKRGVLIIYIYEGINPPYVWNGTIYTRSGSSKIPIKSDRSTIDELLNKGKKFEKKYSEFCVNKFVGEKDSFPYCTIYLYNPYNKIKYDTYGDDANKIKCDLRDINGNEVRIMDSINSVIRKQSDIINATTLTCMEEYFLNDNIKVFCPLFVLDNHNDIDLWVNTVADYNKNINMQDMTIVEGMLNYISMHNTLTNIFKYIKKRGKNICDYNITFEYKNMKNVVFYYNHIRDTQEHKDRFIQSIKDGNIYLCPISEVRTAPLFFLDENEDYELYAMSILEMNYLRLFGINNEIFNDILDNVGDKYNNILFSSDIYKI